MHCRIVLFVRRIAARGDGAGLHAVADSERVRSLPTRRLPHKRGPVHSAPVRTRLPTRMVLRQRLVTHRRVLRLCSFCFL